MVGRLPGHDQDVTRYLDPLATCSSEALPHHGLLAVLFDFIMHADDILVKEIVKSCMARSLELYSGFFGDACVMSNHVHLMFGVDTPSHVDRIMRHLKTESAFVINNLLGRPGGSIWEERYDAPVVLDVHKYIEKAAYILSNPLAADLVETIEEYPHFSSWNGMEQREVVYKCMRFKRKETPQLPGGFVERQVAAKLYRGLKHRCRNRRKLTLTLSFERIFEMLKRPDCSMSFEEFRQAIRERVKELEQKHQERRERLRERVLGRAALESACAHQEHQPEKHGQRMLCLGSSPQERKWYVRTYRKWVQACQEAFDRWQEGARNVLFPPGFYPPGGMRPLASMVPAGFWR